MSTKYIAIIPARGGSKGVPKKNIKEFLGKPLIEHSINYAKESKFIEKIILTTDNEEIKKIGKDNNITVVNRPKEISGDKATTESAIEHVISLFKFSIDTTIVLLQPTSPIRPKNSLDKMIKIFNEQLYDSMLTLSPIHPLTWKIDNKKTECMYDYSNRPRRQDFKEKDLIYDENGSVYIFTNKIFIEKNNRLGGKIGHYIFKEEYGRQIDTPLDFKLLETIGKYLKRKENE
ncbi:MAG: acylneuraminate cytidylyltransferase [Candidatus Marinimicrobia bacterium]|nr:acylneuraminate cytidylyltransferase [Candidatus Neomarinimicrobiota bacterium]|tara:strand:- start:2173 stop:2868 length:696 start_codon:yes stop_codon:yes gene_type:complete